MYNLNLTSRDEKKLLEIEIFVTPYFDEGMYPKKGLPIPFKQITNRTQINSDLSRFGRSCYLDIIGSIKMVVNGKIILDLSQETDFLVSLWYGLDAVTDANLQLIKILRGEEKDRDIIFHHDYDRYDISSPFSCTWLIPQNHKDTLIFSYDSKYGKGEEHLNRNKFSQLFLTESKCFFEKMLTLFPETLDEDTPHILLNLENVNSVRGFLLCEELNRQQNPQ